MWMVPPLPHQPNYSIDYDDRSLIVAPRTRLIHMSYSPCTPPDPRSGSLWSLSLGLLLLCGFISWISAAPRATNQFSVPLFVDQIEQLVLAGNTENLRARPALRRDGTTPEHKGADGSDDSPHAHTAIVLLTDGLSPESIAYVFSSPHLPACTRYTLPASREPPKA